MDVVLKEINIDQITVNPSQPRSCFAQQELEELAASIKAVGVIHPPVVRSIEDGKTYELISGERRWRAAQLAGFKSIEVVVRDATHSHSAQAALIENVQRVDLNPIEIAKALRSLIDQFGLHQDDVAVRVGKKRSTVANYLRLLGLPKNIQDSVTSDTISMGHAKAILSLEGVEKQNLLHELILRDELTVREAEEASHRLARKERKKALVNSNRDYFLENVAGKLQEKLGTKVSVYGRGKKGQIVIDYYNLDDLDRILSIFGIQE